MLRSLCFIVLVPGVASALTPAQSASLRANVLKDAKRDLGPGVGRLEVRTRVTRSGLGQDTFGQTAWKYKVHVDLFGTFGFGQHKLGGGTLHRLREYSANYSAVEPFSKQAKPLRNLTQIGTWKRYPIPR